MEKIEVVTKTQWHLDKVHTELSFKVKHMMVSNVRGFFRDYNASIYTIAEDFTTAEIDIWINAASLYTGDVTRDVHLKSVDFFDVEHFRAIHFTGNSLDKISNEQYALYGDLTIKGITKRVRLDVEFSGIVADPWVGKRAGFVVSGKINRKEWGLAWNALLETGGVLVGEEVYIHCEFEIIKRAGTE